ncbi:MAG TPA: DMT family transporter [Stellaceae bacterium]|nr:DMT family transporter [Stellaceae bacterium]
MSQGAGVHQTDPETVLTTGRGAGAKAAPPRIVYFYLAVIVTSWAGNWPLMKLALGEAGPLPFVLVRLVGALILLLPLLLAVRAPLLPVPGERLGLLWIGLLQVAGFLIFGIIGLAIVPAGRAIVLAYTMPLWAIPIGLWLWPEAFGRRQLVGAAVGFCGLVLFMNPGLVDWTDRRALLGNGLLLLAAICWALGSCLYRRSAWRSPFWTQTFWQLAVSVPPIVAIALPEAAHEPIHWSIGLFGILVYNWVVTTALGYFLWSKVLSVMSAAVAGQVLALTPVGGFLLSIAIFGGAVGGDVVVSIALIVAGIVLTLRG